MPYTPNDQDGHFVWHDLMSTNKTGSLSFYKTLFGWEENTINMGPEVGDYTMFRVNQRDIGGIIPLNPEDKIPSHWISYISVHDIDSACLIMKDKGATIHRPPFEIPGVGRMAILEDPTGAYFSPYQDKAVFDPAETVVPGGFGWHELMTTDTSKSAEFYTSILGWDKMAMPMPDGQTYWVMTKGEMQTAGMVQMPPEAEAPSNWLPYIGVKEVEATAEKAVELGGKIWVAPTFIAEPANVHFAVLSAPDGSMFGIMGA